MDILTALLLLTHFSGTSPHNSPKNVGAGSDDSGGDDYNQ
jgi:hypothetical protein